MNSLLKVRNQGFNEQELPTERQPYRAQENQTAIREHNRKIADEQELVHQMRVASGEATPVVKQTWKKTGKPKGYKDAGRDVLGELVYGRK